jgi:hypothetical protein
LKEKGSLRRQQKYRFHAQRIIVDPRLTPASVAFLTGVTKLFPGKNGTPAELTRTPDKRLCLLRKSIGWGVRGPGQRRKVRWGFEG